MQALVTGMIGIVGLVSVGCSTGTFFPPEGTRDAASIQFGVLVPRPEVFTGRVIQIAGRIVGVEQSADGILIRAQELPMQEHPVYGPAEVNKGTPEFAIKYRGKVDDRAFWFGDKLVVVAVGQGSRPLTVDGVIRTAPYVVARCMHIWKTGEDGSYGIEEYPNLPDGYYSLKHQTYCAN